MSGRTTLRKEKRDIRKGSKVREEDVIGTPKEMPKEFLSREVLHKQRQKAG